MVVATIFFYVCAKQVLPESMARGLLFAAAMCADADVHAFSGSYEESN